jgi:hypothetical protein
MGARVVTVNDVLEGHVALDIQCLDRIYLNAYVPKLQSSAQVVAFLSDHLGYPFPSPALFNQIGQRFRRAVASFAEANDIPWVKFGKDDVGGKLELMRPHLARQAATGVSGVAAIGVAQEFQRVWTAYERQTPTGAQQWWFTKAPGRTHPPHPHTNRYQLTPEGIRIAVFYTKIYNRMLVPLTAAHQPQAPPELRAALATITRHVDAYATHARISPAA